MNYRRVQVLVVGSGAAGLATAERLAAAGMHPEIYTEGLSCGTSINTGSDKQTYYKLGLCGGQGDSPWDMAADLMAGGSMHGDIALCEAAFSTRAFMHLVELGVPFPFDEFGQYAGYKTDHDPRRRATSCGPYTSREMCRGLIRAVKERGIPVQEQRVAVELLVENGRCRGGVFLNLTPGVADPWEVVEAQSTVFACGGPGGLYGGSVYPVVHTGAIGLALAAGARARNLPESQYGLAAMKFRWNLSGSYMQVLPRFYSVDDAGNEYDFLLERFGNRGAVNNLVFLKGYQWPFAAAHIPGSSLVDLWVWYERIILGRRVWLDYRSDPADFDLADTDCECREYLERSGAATGASPYQRLMQLNPAAAKLFLEHGIDLSREPLEVQVAAQHNNGGLAADCNWESENIANLYPVGEVNGSHGVTRPGGSALNSGQCGALQAALAIVRRLKDDGESCEEPIGDVAGLSRVLSRRGKGEVCTPDWRSERRMLQERMDRAGGFLRREESLQSALQECQEQLRRHRENGFPEHASLRVVVEALRNEQLLVAQQAYLSAILAHIQSGCGSRGGALVVGTQGREICPGLSWRAMPEDAAFRSQTLETQLDPAGSGEFFSQWRPCRELPRQEGWFENVWRDFQRKYHGVKWF